VTLRRRQPGEYEQIHVHKVRFVGEQDGLPETLLKNKLTDLFRHEKNVARAYLVRTDLGNGHGIVVVLAVRMKSAPDKAIVPKVGVVFASIFNPPEHLDTMFLTEGQEAELAKVCKPFFEQCQ